MNIVLTSNAPRMPTAPRSSVTRRFTRSKIFEFIALATAITLCLFYIIRYNISFLAELNSSTDSATSRAENEYTPEKRIGDEGILSQLLHSHPSTHPAFLIDAEYETQTSAEEEVQIAPGFHNEEEHKVTVRSNCPIPACVVAPETLNRLWVQNLEVTAFLRKLPIMAPSATSKVLLGM